MSSFLFRVNNGQSQLAKENYLLPPTPYVPIYTGQLLALPSTGTTGASSLNLTGVSTTITGITGNQSFMNGTYVTNGSGNLGGWNPYNLFDGTTGLGFHSPDTPYGGVDNAYNSTKSVIINGSTVFCEWITVQFPYSFALTSYTVNARGGYEGRAPKNFSFSGSNDGINWTLINSQTNIVTGYNTFTISSNTNKYSYYLFSITKCISNDYLNIGEIIMLGSK
jgi:hypothetical protein